jgi:hypothetical protein
VLSVLESYPDKPTNTGFILKNQKASGLEGGPQIEGCNGDSVFFVSVEEMQGAKVNVPSRIRLCASNDCAGPRREELFYFSKLGVVLLHVMAERERHVGVFTPVDVRENRQNVVERVTQVRQNSANPDDHQARQRLELEKTNFLVGLDIHLGTDFIRVCGDKLADVGLELVDFGFGPFGLLVARDERFRFHDDIQGEIRRRETRRYLEANAPHSAAA